MTTPTFRVKDTSQPLNYRVLHVSEENPLPVRPATAGDVNPLPVTGMDSGGVGDLTGTERELVGFDAEGKPTTVAFRPEHWTEEVLPELPEADTEPDSPGRGFWVPRYYERSDGSKSLGWSAVSSYAWASGTIVERTAYGNIIMPTAVPTNNMYGISLGALNTVLAPLIARIEELEAGAGGA